MTQNNQNTLIPNTESLNTFLRKHKIPPGEKRDKIVSTHTTLPGMYHTAGSYHIPQEKQQELYNSIYNHVCVGKKPLHLTESHKGFSYSPFIDDIDTRDSYENNPDLQRKYQEQDIKDYLSYLYESLEKYCELTDDQRYVYIFKKSKPALDTKSGKVKDGWHIMIPNLVAPYELFYLTRANRIMNTGVKELFEKLGYDNSIEDIIDKSVIEVNNWFMYTSGKPAKQPYKLKKIYRVENGNVLEVSRKHLGIVDDRQLIELFSVRNKTPNVILKDDVDIMEIYNKLPDACKSPRHHIKETKTKKESTSKHRPRNVIMNKTSYDIELIKKYVECLNPKRAERYDDWIRVGWCLHNIDWSLLESWIKFSKKSSKFNPGECEDLWYRMKDEGLGLGTLRMWAKNDNRKDYEAIRQQDATAILQRCIHKDHTRISEYIKAKYEDDFVCASLNNKEWYQFKGHRWQYIEDGWSLRENIATSIGYDFQDFAANCFKQMMELRTKSGGPSQMKHGNGQNMMELQQSEETCKQYYKIFTDLAHQLGNKGLLDSIMNECKYRFYDENFRKKLDENDNLLHFTNGVYDLAKDEFREGYPEDYLSLSTNIQYIEDPDEFDYEILAEIQDFFDQVLPEDCVKDYALTLMGSFLSGKNKEQKFYIWTGSGSNGKSMMVDLFQDSLGDYAGTISVSIFTKGRLDANAPSPAVAKLRGKRFVSLQEPEGDDKLHMGIIKQWVGGDKVQGRELNKAPIEFVMKAKFVLVCNDLPTIDSLDGGTWRRIRLLEYLSKFVDNPKKPGEFKIDRSLKDRMEKWREMFLWLLIQYHQKYKKSGIYEPKAVTKVTDEYKENSDFYSQFFNEHLEKDLNSKISGKDAYKYFKIWHKATYEGKKLVLRPNFEKHMSLLMGKLKGNNWHGYRYVEAESQDSDDEDTNQNIMIDDDDEQKSNNDANNNMYSNDIDYEIVEAEDIDNDNNDEDIGNPMQNIEEVYNIKPKKIKTKSIVKAGKHNIESNKLKKINTKLVKNVKYNQTQKGKRKIKHIILDSDAESGYESQ